VEREGSGKKEGKRRFQGDTEIERSWAVHEERRID
jgi:hypothetical protein